MPCACSRGIGAARYKVVLGDGSHQYMALYAFESAAKLAAALSGPEITELITVYDRDIGDPLRRLSDASQWPSALRRSSPWDFHH